MISSVTNRGMLRFMIHEGALNAGLFLTFLQRLVRGAAGKLFLIVDNLKVHKAGKIQAWGQRIVSGSSWSSCRPMRPSTIRTSSCTMT
jgi:hypothetical protein